MKHNLYFIRHGETDENVKRIVQGCGVDSVLNENGLNQGKKFYEHYKNIGFKKMYCSALKRTYQTIQSFEKSHGKIQSDRRLNEISWGEHEGKSGGEEFMRKYFLSLTPGNLVIILQKQLVVKVQKNWKPDVKVFWMIWIIILEGIL
ncbi:MAG: histidine phosphatase family protein [Saprospiraceae bacterium]|nr:histidine phosphatase family protein [Saprospiraceae bacterium]